MAGSGCVMLDPGHEDKTQTKAALRVTNGMLVEMQLSACQIDFTFEHSIDLLSHYNTKPFVKACLILQGRRLQTLCIKRSLRT